MRALVTQKASSTRITCQFFVFNNVLKFYSSKKIGDKGAKKPNNQLVALSADFC